MQSGYHLAIISIQFGKSGYNWNHQDTIRIQSVRILGVHSENNLDTIHTIFGYILHQSIIANFQIHLQMYLVQDEYIANIV